MTVADETLAPSVRRQRRGDLLVWIAVAVVLGGGWVGYWYVALQRYHPFTVQPTILYRDGNRDLREFRHTMDADHIRTVVSLIDDQELADPAKPQFREEEAYCRDHGIRQVRIPVKLGGWPTTDQLQQFFGIVAEPANRPVLVHCAQGVRRTGMFMAAYQLSVMDRSVPYTKGTIQAFGHKDRDLDDIRTFIDHYDPATATVPSELKGNGHE